MMPTSLSRRERMWLVQSSVLVAVLDRTAVISLLARLTLVAPAAVPIRAACSKAAEWVGATAEQE